jgi:hypothetical protein
MKMLETFRSLIIEKKNKFNSTMEQDLMDLKNVTNYKLKCILIYKIGQREILNHCLNSIEKMEKKLMESQKEIDYFIKIQQKPLEDSTLNDWLNNNALKSELNFIKLSRNVGFESKKELESFEDILILKNLISMDTIKKSPIGELTMYMEDDETLFYIYLIFLKQGEKDSSLFIQNLPNSFNNSLFLTNEELDRELQGTSLYHETLQIIDYLTEIVTEANQFLKELKIKLKVNLESLKWAFTVFSSNLSILTFLVYSITSNHERYIIPIPCIPIFNSKKLISKWIDDEQFHMKCISTFEKNEIVSENNSKIL